MKTSRFACITATVCAVAAAIFTHRHYQISSPRRIKSISLATPSFDFRFRLCVDTVGGWKYLSLFIVDLGKIIGKDDLRSKNVHE